MKVFLLCQQIREKSSPESTARMLQKVLHTIQYMPKLRAVVTIARRCKQYVVANLMHRLGVIYLVGARGSAFPGLQVVKWNGNVLGHIIILQKVGQQSAELGDPQLFSSLLFSARLLSYIKYKACRRIYMGISLSLSLSPVCGRNGGILYTICSSWQQQYHTMDTGYVFLFTKMWKNVFSIQKASKVGKQLLW